MLFNRLLDHGIGTLSCGKLSNNQITRGNLAAQAVAGLNVAVNNHGDGAFSGGGLYDGGTDSFSAARDHDNFVFKFEIHGGLC